ncbi:MAG: Fic family protein [Solirubrobacteraceae bacterium]
MDESRHSTPGYRDREESRFFQARGQSPEATWQTLTRELARVLADALLAFWRRPLLIDAERVRWWHGAIFARHFPHDGGHFRKERAFFGVMGRDGRMRRIEGCQPDAVRRELTEVCRAFNTGVERLCGPSAAALDRARVVGSLYAGILRVHPFADGNHRTAFVALSSALWSLGMPAVEFAEDEDMIDHDDALIPALLSRDGDIDPFARLLVARIERAGASEG